MPKDPWGNEYKYTSPAQNAPYEIISLGADGKEGGEGPNKDIVERAAMNCDDRRRSRACIGRPRARRAPA